MIAGNMVDLGLPFTLPLSEKIDLLLDSDRINEALEWCQERGSSLEVRS